MTIPPATAAVAARAAAPAAVRLIALRTFPSPLLLAVLRLAFVAAFDGAFFEAVRLAEDDAARREVAVRFAGDFVVRDTLLAFFRGVLLFADLLLVRAALVEALFLAGVRREAVALFAVVRDAVEREELFAAAFRPLVAARLVDFFAGEVLRVEEAFFVLDFLAVDFVLVDFFPPVDLVGVDFLALDVRPAVDLVLLDFFVPLEMAVADFFEPLADFFALADFALLFPADAGRRLLLDAAELLRLRAFVPEADERSTSFEKRLPLSS